MKPTKSINRDYAKKKNRPQLENEAIAKRSVGIASRLENLLSPAIAAYTQNG
ncbi:MULTISPECIES: hypothetical protein [Nostocales]|uniref:hypothetical protein n=1 Tax=Nostocales TaxID=1161 RepID=UPI000A88B1D0|nr:MULTISPECIES: hypothetical protein [Nostocales]MBO1063647.1 hypothetical protein [Anabaena sp. 54]MCX5984888.1 hypothetical protein [Nostocales cyanobacterium LacPavin_0920_SED1_MAG_38_18]QSV72794.1 MAG: hypothetical protein HEQ20_21140 [Aphanizomenon flos-aquae KM1D3_PB]